MDIESIAVRVLILLNIQIDYTHSSVSWNMTTYPAMFGQDVMLTCYTFHPLENSKDCPVRQWSGGTDGRGLMYNGFSSNEEKYEEKANLLSSQFSLIIRNFSITDINVNYTCSCGFYASTHKLQIDEKRFQYSPDTANASITSHNDTLKIKMQIKKVYPLPNCTVYIGNRVVANKVRLNYRKSGLFYSVGFVAEYKLRIEDCNKQPRMQCKLKKEQITFEGNITPSCSDYTTETSCNENTSLTEENVNTRSSSEHGIAVIIVACICTLLVALVVLCVLARKHTKIIIRKMCQMSKETGNSNTTIECIPKPCTENENHETHVLLT
ncbi:unnamed protein product [Mytilus coruscus]|uniref:Ig-like domain-containing protein n=1 Tax=Mytilus coruscus TaxID=42192 RepID=A0A6J7ZXF7_MYTCO|nr:unnamed protein product [Mytilus coruscus]